MIKAEKMEIFQIVRHVMSFFCNAQMASMYHSPEGFFHHLGATWMGLTQGLFASFLDTPKPTRTDLSPSIEQCKARAPGYVVCWGFLGG